MNAKTYLTISAILAILYGLSFELFPGQVTEMFGVTPEAHMEQHCSGLAQLNGWRKISRTGPPYVAS